jgi:iron complex transport system substrate-binding protein
LLALKPDLVVVSSPGSFSKLERLRDAGLEVFDLGSQSGLDSLVPAALRLGAVLGVQARAEQLMKAFRGRLERLAKGVEPPRRSAAYVASYAGKLLSAGRGTSYHDVLQHAGLVDVVSGVFSGYPELSAEQLLDLDPDLIVSPTGAGEVLCRRPGLARLRACSRAGAVIEIDGALLGDTGLGMLEAAERVHAAAYPDGDSPAQ